MSPETIVCETIDTEAALRDMVDYLGTQEWFSWDHETRSVDYAKDPNGALKRLTMKSDLVSFSTLDRAFVIPLGLKTIKCLDEEYFFQSIKHVMENNTIEHAGWNCFRADTEFLTPNGWIKAKDVTGAECLAQWSYSGAIEFERPIKVIRKPNDESRKLHISGEHIDFHVTEDHRIITLSRNAFGDYTPKEFKAHSFSFSSKRRIPVSGYLQGGSPLDANFARLNAALQADGYKNNGAWCFAFSKPRKITRLRDLMTAAGVSFSENSYKSGKTVFRLMSHTEEVSCLLEDKVWSLPKLLCLDEATLRVITSEILLWDGSGTVYSSSVRANVDAMQTAAHLCSLRATITESVSSSTGKAHYYLSLVDKSYATDASKGEVTEESWRGSYCVSMPSSYILVRSGGKIAVCGQCSFDMHAMANYGVWVQNFTDLMVAAYLLDETRSASLKERCNDIGMNLHKFDFKPYWLARSQLTGETERPKRGKVFLWQDLEQMEQEYLLYSADDAIATAFLREKLLRELEDEPKLKSLFFGHRNKSVRTLFRMERRGIPIDRHYLKTVGEQCAKDVLEAERKVYAEAGQHFKIGSTKDLSRILYDELGLPVYKTTGTGASSTDSATLAHLAQDGHAIAQRVVEWRRHAKMLSTYIGEDSKLVGQVYPWGHIHPSFNPCGTKTGRLSSSDPNAQNFPQSNARSYNFREMFIASDGYTLVGGDYSQIELRIMAHNSIDPAMCAEYRKDAELQFALANRMPLVDSNSNKLYSASDIHQKTADTCHSSRNQAKGINFGLLYGMGSEKLADILTQANWIHCQSEGYVWEPDKHVVTPEQAKLFVTAFFTTYAGIKAYQHAVTERVKKYGFVETRFGQKRRLPDAYSSDSYLQHMAYRQGVNTTIQGHVGELMLHNMNIVDGNVIPQSKRLREAQTCLLDSGYRLFMQVHDEVLGEAPIQYASDCAWALTVIFQEPMECTETYPHFGYRIPLVFEAKTGPTWNSVH